MRLAHEFVTTPCGTDAFSVRFSPDGSLLAASGAQGWVCVFNAGTSQEAYRLNRNERHPVKQLCWRPERADSSLRTRSVLVGASTDGRLRQWHVTSKRLLHTFADSDETGQLLCVDYAPDGRKLFAAGLHGEVFAFDEETRGTLARMRGGGGDSAITVGHSSRVLAIRAPPACQQGGSPDVVFTGGWDNTVQVWDIRAGHAVRQVIGPHICGDALDVDAEGRLLLTGSWRADNQLEVWDIGTGRRLEEVRWRAPGSRNDPECWLYSARFARGNHSLLAAGGSLPAAIDDAGEAGGRSPRSNNCHGEAKVFLRDGSAAVGCPAASGSCAALSSVGTLVNFTCLSCDFSPVRETDGSQLVAMGGSDGRIRTMRLETGPEAKTAPPQTSPPPRGSGYPTSAQ